MKRGLPSVVHDRLSARVVSVHRVGKMCVVNFIPDSGGEWLEVGGISPQPNPLSGRAPAAADDNSPEGLPLVDPEQSRIYYRNNGAGTTPDILVFRPSSFRFRSSAKGRNNGRSKSYDDAGLPIPQVRLLYALKSGHYDDRIAALRAYPFDFWVRLTLEDGPWGEEFDGSGPWDHEFNEEFEKALEKLTLGSIFNKQESTACRADNYLKFVGREIARAAALPGGLSDWTLWEKAADKALASQDKLREGAEAVDHVLFIQAVKETACEFQGLPAQHHVRKKWVKLGGKGEWPDVRRTLGFDWLPTKVEWDKSWKPGITETS